MPDQQPDPLDGVDPHVLLDVEVTGPDLDTMLAALRRDIATLIGPGRHVEGAVVAVGVENSITDTRGLPRIIEWNARLQGRVSGPGT